MKLFGEIGLPNDRGLLAETTDRLARRFLPEPPALHELWMLAGQHPALDRRSGRGSARPRIRCSTGSPRLGGTAWDPLRGSILDAISLIATRIAALGMAEAFRTRRGRRRDPRVAAVST